MADRPQKNALRWLALLAAATVLSIAGAVIALSMQENATRVRFEPRPFFDDLAGEINRAEKIVFTIGRGLSDPGKITLNRDKNGGWQVEQRFGFPAKSDQVRKLIVGLVELEAFEPRTSNPEWHRELGLAAPEDLGSATRVELIDGDGEPFVQLLAGKVVEDTKDAQGRGFIYARKEGEDQAWLARGRLPLNTQVTDWLELDIFQLKREDIKRVVLWAGTENPVIIERESADERNFHIANLPEGRTGRGAAIVNGPATALVDVEPEDVIPGDKLDFEEGSTAAIDTFGGMRFIVRMTGGAGVLWAKISAEADAALLGEGGDLEAAEKRAAEVNALTEGWAFRFGQEVSVKLAQTMQALTRPADGE